MNTDPKLLLGIASTALLMGFYFLRHWHGKRRLALIILGAANSPYIGQSCSTKRKAAVEIPERWFARPISAGRWYVISSFVVRCKPLQLPKREQDRSWSDLKTMQRTRQAENACRLAARKP